MTQTGPRRVTVLRGADLRTGSAAALPGGDVASSRAQQQAAVETGTLQSPYGVPASAVQHCCGRGCRHCRIYWHRGEK